MYIIYIYLNFIVALERRKLFRYVMKIEVASQIYYIIIQTARISFGSK